MDSTLQRPTVYHAMLLNNIQ